MAKYKLACSKCDWKERETEYFIGCPKCGGFLDVAFDKTPEKIVDNDYKSIFRFHNIMPFDIEDKETLEFEDIPETPIIYAKTASEKLGIELYYKDETVLPSGTWKDREGFISAYRMYKNNIDNLFVFSSGNTGTSVARSVSIFKKGKLHLVIPEASKKRVATYKEFFQEDFVKLNFFDGSNDECIDYAKNMANEKGFQVEGGFSNYARREGLKLLALEVIGLWDKKPDWYVQSIAGGIGIYSYFKAYRDLGKEDECPRLLGVQAKVCSPMANAWKADAATLENEHIPQEVTPSDYVRVLRTRKPTDSYPILKKIMDKVQGRFEDVEDTEIHEALRLFYKEDYYKSQLKEKNILVGLEAATAMAGVIKSVKLGNIKPGERVLLNVSGAAKDGDIKMEWIQDLLD